MRHFLTIFSFILIIIPSSAYALSCSIPSGKGLIQQYDVIFKGTAVETKSNQGLLDKLTKQKRRGHDSYTTFEISEVIKGNVADKIEIHHTTQSSIGGSKSFVKKTEYMIFARRSEDNTYNVGACTPIWNLDQLKENAKSKRGGIPRVSSLWEIEKYQSLKSGIDKIINEYGGEGNYLEKAKLLEDYKDYEQAKLIYEDLARKTYRKTLERLAGKSPYYYNDFQDCYPAVETAPTFIKEIKAVTPHDGLKPVRKHLLGYGRSLFLLGQYQEALRPLCLAGSRDKEAIALKTQALAKLGLTDELEEHQINLSKASLEDVDLSNLDLQRANFSESHFRKLKLNNSNLTAANFEKAKLKYIEATGVNLSGSKLEEAEISGDLSNSNLSYAKGKKSFIKGDLTNSDLKNSDFKDAKISGDMTGVDLKDATLEGAYIHKLAGAKLDNTNLHGIQSSFGQFPGRGADYSSVNLSNFDLSGSKFFSTNFTGAKFNNSNLSDAGLIASNFQDADFSGANLKNADLSSSNREETNLSGADLSSANLEGAKLTAARYDCKTRFPEGFNPKAHLMVSGEDCGANNTLANEIPNFSRANLLLPPNNHYRLINLAASMNFKNIDLKSTDFEGAKLGRFQTVNLSNANFEYTTGVAEIFASNLEGANFSYSNLDRLRLENNNNLKDTKFYCAILNNLYDKDKKLKEADLTAAIFSSANFQEWNYDFDPIKNKILFRFMQKIIDKYGPADYSGMDLSNCDLRGMEFGATNLSNAVFSGTVIARTDVTQANLEGANFSGAITDYSTKFPESFEVIGKNMVGSRLYYSNIEWAPSEKNFDREQLLNFSKNYGDKYARHRGKLKTNDPLLLFGYQNTPNLSGKNLDKANYRGAWLAKSNLEGASMQFINLAGSVLLDANMQDTNLKGAILQDAILDGANLNNANLYGADLRWARMKETKLDGAKLTNAIYDNNTVWPEGFDPISAGAFSIDASSKAKQKLSKLPGQPKLKKKLEIPEGDKFTNLPSDTQILALSLYKGRDKNGASCGHGRNRQCIMNVSVQKNDSPILLVLAAYEPSTWKLDIKDDVQLQGVLISGLYEQSIKGVPGNIRVINHSSKETNYDLKFFGGDKQQLKKMDAAIKAITGKEAKKMIKPDEHGNFIVE